ncbi:apicoplast ribosomal protein S10 precursor, putative [Plasmodium relictum]|uniref:Apicoplast ribosomal protein S10, putative n=1 Tax=Plasmodium relictum TaxID=85471 RepID=A0A1J1H8T6_PLARL|nr:apicoplast ribosomal protein S10 precursor, putative [Plasmodium relictum]CRH01315.1 apicoplast ribosomal protein S10 precursor, putative [Plasmodium relictum]
MSFYIFIIFLTINYSYNIGNSFKLKPKINITFFNGCKKYTLKKTSKLYNNLEKVNNDLKKEDIIKKWSENYHLRIVLNSYFSDHLQKAVLNIKEKISQYPQFHIAGPIPQKTIKKRFTFLRSPHVDKDSREQFEIKQYGCKLDIYLNSSITLKNSEFVNFLSVKLPRFVGFEYYFEENYKGLTKKEINDLKKKKYVSKYYTNIFNSKEKKKYVDLLLENSKYMNVKLPRNFYDLYKYPLEILRHFYKKTMEKKKWYHENEELMKKIESLSYD